MASGWKPASEKRVFGEKMNLCRLCRWPLQGDAKHRSGSRPTVCSSAAGRTRQWVTVCPTLVRRSRNEPTESSRGSIDTRFGEEARSLVTARTRRVPTETGLPAPVRHGLSADCPILIFKAGRTHRNAESPPSEGCRDLDV